MISLLITLLYIVSSPVSAEVKLPHIIGSGMVLQRDMPIPIWGWADPGEEVTVEFKMHQVGAIADAQGKWMVKLAATEAGGPYKMTIRGSNVIVLTDILVGEVWFCSGQSNMEMGIGVVNNPEQEIAAANYPEIRLFDVPKRPSGQPASDVGTVWSICTSKSISSGGWGGFSAVAYFFGREIHKKLDVPVGLIDASWGGSHIEPWTPPDAFASAPKLQHISRKIEQVNGEYRKKLGQSLDSLEEWIRETRTALAENKALLPEQPDYPHHPFIKNEPYQYPWQPTGLYNGMIHPLIPFAIRGAIWYQGESNLLDGMMYHEKMKALITGWRKLWQQGNFPFYFVQLAPFKYDGWPSKDVTPTSLPEIWQAQLASLIIPNTGMVVTTDITELDDIHPHNKQDVGKRLALWALAKTYGQADLVYSGPLYRAMFIQDRTIRISFDHVGTGLTSSDGGPLRWFEVAGRDEKFVKAKAEISGNSVLVWSDDVIQPVAVRFGWHQEATPNLSNKEGLPASPFRTDKW